MSVASSVPSFATLSKLSISGAEAEELLDDIRLEEGDVDLSIVPFSQIRVNEIVTQGSFKYYHGFVESLPSQEDVSISGDEGEQKGSYFALQCLNDRSLRRGLKWIKETSLVAPLKHQNIRNIHAMSKTSLSECLERESLDLNISNRYFLVVDPIQESLRRRMGEWRSQDNRKGSIRASLGGKNNVLLGVDGADALDRVKLVGHEVCKAMVYLHSKNIAFGPLTPEKVGFDRNGTIKLTDFSEAQFTSDSSVKELCGVDVHYFGLFLWQLYTLEEPSQMRPPLKGVIPSERLREMMKQCWDKDFAKRPHFRRLTKRLLEATSTCRHSSVQAQKDEEIGEEYLQEDASPSLRNFFKANPKGKKSKIRQSFRVSKVDLTLNLTSLEKEQAVQKRASMCSSLNSCDRTVNSEAS